MAKLISIEEVEAIINRARIVAPPADGVLSPELRVLSTELRVLAEIYSDMISDRTQLIDLDQLTDKLNPIAILLLGVPLDDRPHDGRQYRLPF